MYRLKISLTVLLMLAMTTSLLGWEKAWPWSGYNGTSPSQARMLTVNLDPDAMFTTYTVHAVWEDGSIIYAYSPNSGSSWQGEMYVPSAYPFGNFRPATGILPDNKIWLCKLNNPSGGLQGVELAVQRERPPEPGEEYWYYDPKASASIWPKALAMTLSSGTIFGGSGTRQVSSGAAEPMVYLITTKHHTSPLAAELWFMAIDTLQGSPYYDTVLAVAAPGHDFQPSITHAPGDYIHIAYRCEQDRIWHLTWDEPCKPSSIRDGISPSWDVARRISDDDWEPASEPSIDAYGGWVYCAWRGPNEYGQPIGEIYQAARNPFQTEWGDPENISESPNRESGSPQCHTGTTVIWQEQVSGQQDAFETMVRWTPGPIMQLSNSPDHDSRWPHVAVINPVPWGGLQFRTYALWSDQDRNWPSADSIRFRYYNYIPRLAGDPEYPSYLSAALGQEEQSPYCRSRDGFYRYKEATVDYSRTELLYHLPFLDPMRDYTAELVVFNGEQEPVVQSYSFGEKEAGTITVRAGDWDTLYIQIPRTAYPATVAKLKIANVSGPHALLAGLKLYDAPYKTPSGDGPQAQPGGRVSVIQAEPNPFTESCLLRLSSEMAGARVRIHDVTGRLVRELSGSRALVWDGQDSRGQALPAGVYYGRVENDNEQSWVKLVKK